MTTAGKIRYNSDGFRKYIPMMNGESAACRRTNLVGNFVGKRVGNFVGYRVVGNFVGNRVGYFVGYAVPPGASLSSVGDFVGSVVFSVGERVGSCASTP